LAIKKAQLKKREIVMWGRYVKEEKKQRQSNAADNKSDRGRGPNQTNKWWQNRVMEGLEIPKQYIALPFRIYV
jgi:endoglucanase Acf2